MLIETKALVLKRIPYGDTSVICRLFTKEAGKISIVAKGAWKQKNAAGYILEPINHVHINYYNKNTRNIQILKNVEFVQHFSSLRNNLSRMILAFSVIEIIDHSTLENNPYPILYRLGWRVLDKINDNNQNCWFVFAFFLYQIVLRLGFMLNLKNCTKCNRDVFQGGIDDYSGEIVCATCVPQSKIKINKNGCIFLKQLSELHLDNLNTISISKSDIIDSIYFLESFILFHIDGLKRVRSMGVLRKLLNSSIKL